MLVLRRLGILAFTAVAAPSVCFLLFEGLRMDPFSAGTLMAEYRSFISASLLHGDLGRTEQFDESGTTVIRQGMALPFVSGAGQDEELPSDPLAFIRALWVPCIVVELPTAAGVYRMTIASAREVLGEEFVRTARGKGLRERRVLIGHVLPVAGIPVLILAASQVNLLITNVCLMQSAFDIPGSFRYLVANTANADLSMLYGLIVWGCLLIAVANFAVDVLQSRLDPRVGAALRRG